MRNYGYVFAAAALLAAAPVHAQGLDYVGECVPFARATSGIQIFGNAWTWWKQADGRYMRGHKPRIGAVMVFAQSSKLRLGHVAVVSRIVTPRILMITHANWSRQNGVRGHTEQDVTLTDVSARGDWSNVRVWYRDTKGLGTTVYPVSGFVYGKPDRRAARPVAEAEPAAYLTARNPDYVGALIDVYAR